MTNRMLINASQTEEVRVAIVHGSRLDNLDIEVHGKEQQKASVYKGKITRIEPSLEAVFVDYGGERHGFLPFREVSRTYYRNKDTDHERASIRDRLTEGQEVIVQVDKETRGNKGAALTTFISLAGCYLVLMPMNPTAGGISRRIDGEDRAELRDILNSLNVPEGMGIIVRTAGVGRDTSDLQRDLDMLLKQWEAIEKASTGKPAPFLIFQESSVVVRAIRDHLRADINEILVDTAKTFEEVNKHVKVMRPDFINKVKFYNDSIPLFSRFQIESQIEMAFQREVTLPSGGAIVIDHTEALISIDINSAKATKGVDIEETALHTNLEAAEEIARQLRLRDIGGLIVIDFIDMSIQRNQRAVEQKLKEALEVDRARVQVGKISRFGLLEMSRQRLRPALSTGRDIVCPRCLGQGSIRGVEVLSVGMLRLLEEEAIKDQTAKIILESPNTVATYLINEKRQAVLDIERKHHISIIIIPSEHLHTPNYLITRIKKDNTTEKASYTMGSKPEMPTNQYAKLDTVAPVAAAVSNLNLAESATKPGIIKRIFTSLIGNETKQEPVVEVASKPRPTHQHNQHNQHSQQRRRNNNQRRRPPHAGNSTTPRPPHANNPNATPRPVTERVAVESAPSTPTVTTDATVAPNTQPRPARKRGTRGGRNRGHYSKKPRDGNTRDGNTAESTSTEPNNKTVDSV